MPANNPVSTERVHETKHDTADKQTQQDVASKLFDSSWGAMGQDNMRSGGNNGRGNREENLEDEDEQDDDQQGDDVEGEPKDRDDSRREEDLNADEENSCVGEPKDNQKKKDESPEKQLPKNFLEEREKNKFDLSDFPEEDRKPMQKLEEALARGDFEEFKAGLQSLANDPQRLQQIVQNLDKHFAQMGRQADLGYSRRSPLDISMGPDGNVLLHIPGEKSSGLSINPSTGQSSVVQVGENNGNQTVRPVDGGSLYNTFDTLSNRFNLRTDSEVPIKRYRTDVTPNSQSVRNPGYELPRLQLF